MKFSLSKQASKQASKQVVFLTPPINPLPNDLTIKESSEMTSTSSKKIYIVDDDESVCRALSILLMTFGFMTKTFNSSKSFFEAISKDDTGCLLLDIHMPELNGWEVQKRIMDSGSKRPVIFISAENPDIVEDRALKAGAVGFFQKPVNGQMLVDLINATSEVVI
jgi:FixJ family two-component response regulator